MKIGLSTSVIGRGKTGIAQYVFGLTRALAEYAGEISLSLFVLEEDLPLFDFARSFATLVSVAERHRPPVKNIFWHQWELPKLARRLELDVLHVPSYRRMVASAPCARVATIHDLAPCRLAKKYEWKRMIYGKLIARRLAMSQDEIIAVSNTTAVDIAEFFKIPRKRVTVIYNGIDHQRFFPDPSSGPPIPYFLYVARLEHPGKNHWRLIEAFNKFKAQTKSLWQLVLAGSDWQAAEIIHRAARQSPFAADIRCPGFVAEADLPTLYRGAGVFIYPSLYEGFGLPPVEAMACGCPVITSARGALGEVTGGAAEIIDPENIESIAAAMKLVASDTETRKRLREAGLRRAESFDWRFTAAATMQIYTRAAQSCRAKSVKPILQSAATKACEPSRPA